jgi:hypothetical protein
MMAWSICDTAGTCPDTGSVPIRLWAIPPEYSKGYTVETITIVIQTGNAAFADEPASEIARILRDTAARFERAGDLDGHKLRDINGNTVGTITIR